MSRYLPMESNLGSKASDLIALLGVNIGENSVCTWGDFPWEVDILGEGHLALVKRALEVSLANRVAAISFLVDKGDETIFDLEMHLEALLNLVLEIASCLDAKLRPTVFVLAHCLRTAKVACILGRRTPEVGLGPNQPSQSSKGRLLGHRRSRVGCLQGPCTPP